MSRSLGIIAKEDSDKTKEDDGSEHRNKIHRREDWNLSKREVFLITSDYTVTSP